MTDIDRERVGWMFCITAILFALLAVILYGCHEEINDPCTKRMQEWREQRIADNTVDANDRQRLWQDAAKCRGPAKPEIKEIN